MIAGTQARRVKTALDETRLLILGAEILFGFHLNGAFQNDFNGLAPHARTLHAVSFMMMAICIALLIAPAPMPRRARSGSTNASSGCEPGALRGFPPRDRRAGNARRASA